MIYGLVVAAVAGQPSGALPPPPPRPQSASPMKELLSLLTWQLTAAQELYRHLSIPSPLLVFSLLTICIALQNLYTLILDILHEKRYVSLKSGNFGD